MVSLDTTSSGHPYVKTMKVLQFNKIIQNFVKKLEIRKVFPREWTQLEQSLKILIFLNFWVPYTLV